MDIQATYLKVMLGRATQSTQDGRRIKLRPKSSRRASARLFAQSKLSSATGTHAVCMDRSTTWVPPWLLNADYMTELPYRPNVCLLVYNSEKKLFLGERLGSPGVWQLPQGGIEGGMSLEENVLRELEEELGVSPERFRLVKKLSATHKYDFAVPPPYAVGKWRGQDQIFYLVEFVGTDLDIKLDRHTPEFGRYQWATVAEVKQLAEPRRLPGYIAPLHEFEEAIAEAL